jgi:hypothetical protein
MRRRTDVRSFFINPCMITQTSESFIWQLSGCRSDGWCELIFFPKGLIRISPPPPADVLGEAIDHHNAVNHSRLEFLVYAQHFVYESFANQ